MTTMLTLLAYLAALAPPAPAAGASGGLRWDARAAEHLLSRAGFGATPEELARAVAEGPEATVERLLAAEGGAAFPTFEPSLPASDEPYRAARGLGDEERRAELTLLRRDDRHELSRFVASWVERLLESPAVLEERMTLFWHGLFPSSWRDVQRTRELVLQHALLREHALGSFRELLHGIARDPAMLEYLDNDANRKESPNENFARELLELFTLGEGRYSEEDVREVARAFTGWTDRDGAFVVVERWHDDGPKRVLGQRGRFDGDDVLEILLARDDCARHLARRLLAWFEGLEPSRERVERYARLLRRADWELRPVLRALFLDPAFYRDEATGSRVAGPLDFLVGTARRAGLAPPPRLVAAGAAALGQRLCHPPSVEGWREGTAWITTGTLLLRANLAAALAGELPPREAFGGEGALAGLDAARDLRGLGSWRPSLAPLVRALAAEGPADDAALVRALGERLLAVEPCAATLAAAERLLAEERTARGVAAADLLRRPALAEPCLRPVAALLLAAPEANLH